MLIEKQEKGKFIGGPLDVLCILHNINTGRYHAAFFEESPLPGPVPDIKNTKIVRLKSKMHHTEGSDTLEGALEHLKKLSEQIEVSEENIWKEPQDWNGDLGIVWLKDNWKK